MKLQFIKQSNSSANFCNKARAHEHNLRKKFSNGFVSSERIGRKVAEARDAAFGFAWVTQAKKISAILATRKSSSLTVANISSNSYHWKRLIS